MTGETKPQDTSLRLRFGASLLIFVSGYSPLLLILAVKDLQIIDYVPTPQHPRLFCLFIALAIASSLMVLAAVKSIRSGLVVEVTKASNKSGEMFGYTIPYVLSFVRIDLGEWQTLVSLVIFLAVMFAMAYRTQTVFVNPVLAVAGYMLIDCTFRRAATETQAMVVTRVPIRIGASYTFERLSHYLYVAAEVQENSEENP
ncbi:MAG: hypothetical protein KF871_04850 [Hydrogenophaga sp.]|uniref:hypothetical protein n=1 Tax=Hydrogenophaga sp. TaxID=1904254 RepID=UPI001D360420|nr:hypothetical protein [Hydrogenophaga sp.]MBX3609203.1 hypothetical protein [Hydrogenophaga sp.]